MNEVSKSLLCVSMRNGVEMWVEKEKAEKLQEALQRITQSKFIRYEGQTVNTADIVGIFDASTMADLTRRKNGQWKCKKGEWHESRQDCDCGVSYEELSIFEDKSEEERARTIKALEEIKKKMFNK